MYHMVQELVLIILKLSSANLFVPNHKLFEIRMEMKYNEIRISSIALINRKTLATIILAQEIDYSRLI